jgi:antitoxin (DNA-binding transcriptional repressor) of toxin-antitoxin stability system
MDIQKINIQQFQKDFDRFIDEVENGKTFMITSEHGNVMLIPYKNTQENQDDLIRIYTDHEEGS